MPCRDPTIACFSALIYYVKSAPTGCSWNIVFFSSNVVIFLNPASSAAALVFDLPLCTHTVTEGKQSPEYIKNLQKNTIFIQQPVAASWAYSGDRQVQGVH